MRICTLLGVLGGLALVGWIALAFFVWRREKQASRRHKEQLRLCSTQELYSRAWNWGALNRHAARTQTPPGRAGQMPTRSPNA